MRNSSTRQNLDLFGNKLKKDRKKRKKQDKSFGERLKDEQDRRARKMKKDEEDWKTAGYTQLTMFDEEIDRRISKTLREQLQNLMR